MNRTLDEIAWRHNFFMSSFERTGVRVNTRLFQQSSDVKGSIVVAVVRV